MDLLSNINFSYNTEHSSRGEDNAIVHSPEGRKTLRSVSAGDFFLWAGASPLKSTWYVHLRQKRKKGSYFAALKKTCSKIKKRHLNKMKILHFIWVNNFYIYIYIFFKYYTPEKAVGQHKWRNSGIILLTTIDKSLDLNFTHAPARCGRTPPPKQNIFNSLSCHENILFSSSLMQSNCYWQNVARVLLKYKP